MGFDITAKTRYNTRKSRRKDRWSKDVSDIRVISSIIAGRSGESQSFGNQSEILQVEFKTLLLTLLISFIICGGLTYSLISVSRSFSSGLVVEQFQFFDHSTDPAVIGNLLVKTGITSFESELNATESDIKVTKILDF